jgi:hypothetical protein
LKKIFLVLIAVFFGFLSHSQSLLSFCTFVNNPTQECIFDNTKFITTPDSTHGRIFMMLKSSQAFGTAKLTFKVFGIDRFGNEVLVNTIVQDVQPEWLSAWQPGVFTSPGKYMVKVYKEDGTLINSRGFEFFNY